MFKNVIKLKGKTRIMQFGVNCFKIFFWQWLKTKDGYFEFQSVCKRNLKEIDLKGNNRVLLTESII